MLSDLTKVTKLSQTQGLAGQGHFRFPLSFQARGSMRPGPGSTTYMPVGGRDPGWTLEHFGSRLKSAKNLPCDLGQAKCLNAQARSLKLGFQCARALVRQPGWARVIHFVGAQSNFT